MASNEGNDRIEETPFKFLELPREVRDMIYGYSVVSLHKIKPYGDPTASAERHHPINEALFLVTHKVKDEALEVFYSENTGIIGDFKHVKHVQQYIKSFPSGETQEKHQNQIRLHEKLANLGGNPHEVYILRARNIVGYVYTNMVRCFKKIEVKIDFINIHVTVVHNGHATTKIALLRSLIGRVLHDGPDNRKSWRITFNFGMMDDKAPIDRFLEALKLSGVVELFRELAWVRNVSIECSCEEQDRRTKRHCLSFHTAFRWMICNCAPGEKLNWSDD